jgi:type I restriction enzyme M protein
MAIGTTVKTIQDIMRKDAGVDGDAQRISQLGWMLFLKVFDDHEAEKEEMEGRYKSPIPENLRWRTWAADPEGTTGEALLDFVNNNLFRTLKELPAAGKNAQVAAVVRGVFEDAYNYMKSGTLMRQVINKLNEIDFNRASDRHEFGDIYEKILSDLQSAGNAGEFYTPRAVTQFIVDQVDPKLGQTILDPACGTGGFLTCAIEHVRGKYVKSAEDEALLQASIFGVEKKQMPHLLCVTNMLFHGIEVPSNIRRDNTLGRPLRDYGPKDRVDVIVTNPPFGGMEEDGIEMNFPQAFRTRETADLFLVLLMTLLKPEGRAALVLPDGTLFGEGIKTRIKEKLLEECNLHTVVRLPKGVFSPYTGIKTNLLFFEKGKATKDVWFYEHPYPEGYKSYSKTKPMRIEEFGPEKKWWGKRKENDHAWKVTIEEIKARGYNLDVKNPRAVEAGLGDPDELLRQYREAQAEAARIRTTLCETLAAAISGTHS